MPYLCMRHDFRAPAFGPASTRDIYAAALEQYEWADRNGFDLLVLSEHHGIDDGWQPAPLTMAGVVLGRTRQARLMVSAAILPLHDPVRVAEQIAVLDNSAPGRLWVVVGAGYRVEEFEMAGLEHAARGKILEEYVGVLLQAWQGEPFEWRGRTVTVTPKPATTPHPMLLVGGGVPAAARRAARLRLPMLPMNTDQVVRDAYADEGRRVGYKGLVVETVGPTFVHVADDPDRAWSEIAPYVLYEAQTYASYQTPGQHSTPGVKAETVDDLRASPQFVVGTPEQVRARLQQVPADGSVTFSPLAGGLPPDLSWASLELFAAQVLPALRPSGRAPDAARH
jgi:alkanesulfonate monooxygenase SsuD/methylene tetrahydromethanopterin reductase-like flavin-dependent oxidoreductase (luciferase family)